MSLKESKDETVTINDNSNEVKVTNRNDKPYKTDLISRQDAIDVLDVLCQEHRYKIPGKRETYSQYNEAWQDALDRAEGAIGNLPSAQPEEVIPHRNYKYLSDYWCECGWHLGKKNEVKYCSDCGRKVNWDG